jgi:hypothetical protein
MKACFCIYLPEIHVLATVAAVVLSTLVAYFLFGRTLRKFEYRKLEKDEIRLLVIKKDNFSNPVIRCSIKHAELAQRPQYTALSYAWGELTETKTIICSGAEVQITASLYTALRRLRSESQDYVIWADAISINQEDVEERNLQVAMMGRIYSLATRVIVWLGEQERHEGERAFDFLRNLHGYLSGRSASYASGGPIQASQEFLLGIQQMNFSVLKTLFDRPWFRRLWVVQEVVKSRESILMFGTQTMPWTLLERVIPAIAAVGGTELLSAQIGDISMHNILSIIRTAYNQDSYQIRESSRFDLVTLLYELHLRECSDPRDKIYALLGLAWSEGLVPDYRLTAQEVTHKFVDWCVTQDVSLRFLFHAGISSHGPQHDGPSWFPHISRSYCPRLVIGQAARVNASKVSPSEEVRKSLLDDVSITADTLTLIGTKVDTVSKLTQTSLRFIEGIRSLDAEIEIAEDVAKLAIESLNLAHESSIPFKDDIKEEKYIQFCNALTVGQCKLAEDSMDTVHRVIGHYKKYHTTRDPTDIMGVKASEAVKDYTTRGFIGSVLYRRCFTVTSEERFGIVPTLSQQGDWIVIFRGSTVPFVVRPREDGHFTLVGACYVVGIMIGEALENPGIEWGVFKLR